MRWIMAPRLTGPWVFTPRTPTRADRGRNLVLVGKKVAAMRIALCRSLWAVPRQDGPPAAAESMRPPS